MIRVGLENKIFWGGGLSMYVGMIMYILSTIHAYLKIQYFQQLDQSI